MLTIIIPLYSVNVNLDICLLSILGQVQIKQMEIICVPLTHIDAQGALRLTAWMKRDSRIMSPLTEPAPTLYDAFRVGIASATGDYIMFLNQTDMISSPQNLLSAVTVAQQLQVQVLLTAKEIRIDTDAYSPSLTIKPRKSLLPKTLDNTVYSVANTNFNVFFLTPPVVYGNIYQRDYMANMFQHPHVFANAADLAVSQIALLHAKRVSHTDISTIRCRYEACPPILLTSHELSMTQETIVRQITVKLATNKAEMIVGNITLLYISHLLSSYHPYSAFVRAVAHYHPLCKQLADSVYCYIYPHLSKCQRYISAISHSTLDNTDSLIETYTIPSRSPLFSEPINQQ